MNDFQLYLTTWKYLLEITLFNRLLVYCNAYLYQGYLWWDLLLLWQLTIPETLVESSTVQHQLVWTYWSTAWLRLSNHLSLKKKKLRWCSWESKYEWHHCFGFIFYCANNLDYHLSYNLGHHLDLKLDSKWMQSYQSVTKNYKLFFHNYNTYLDILSCWTQTLRLFNMSSCPIPKLKYNANTVVTSVWQYNPLF